MINVKLADNTVLKLEEDLLQKFQENCDLLDINYKIAENGDLQLVPPLTGKTILIQLLDNVEIITEMANSIKEELIRHDAICLVSNKHMSSQAIKFLDAQIILCFSNNNYTTDYNTIKFFTSKSSNSATSLASKIIKKIARADLNINYSVASWWDYVTNVKYWQYFFNSPTPTVLIELSNFEQLKDLRDKFQNIITSSIVEHYKKTLTKEDTKIIVSLVKEIYSEIKAEVNRQNEENRKIASLKKLKSIKRFISNSKTIPTAQEDDSQEKPENQTVAEMETQHEENIQVRDDDMTVTNDAPKMLEGQTSEQQLQKSVETKNEQEIRLPQEETETGHRENPTIQIKNTALTKKQAAPQKRNIRAKNIATKKITRQHRSNYDPLSVPGDVPVFQFAHDTQSYSGNPLETLPPNKQVQYHFAKNIFRPNGLSEIPMSMDKRNTNMILKSTFWANTNPLEKKCQKEEVKATGSASNESKERKSKENSENEVNKNSNLAEETASNKNIFEETIENLKEINYAEEVKQVTDRLGP